MEILNTDTEGLRHESHYAGGVEARTFSSQSAEASKAVHDNVMALACLYPRTESSTELTQNLQLPDALFKIKKPELCSAVS